MPVVARRQDTGALVQRFVFPATIADVNVKLDPRGAVVATSRALWALCRRDVASATAPGKQANPDRQASSTLPGASISRSGRDDSLTRGSSPRYEQLRRRGPVLRRSPSE